MVIKNSENDKIMALNIDNSSACLKICALTRISQLISIKKNNDTNASVDSPPVLAATTYNNGHDTKLNNRLTPAMAETVCTKRASKLNARSTI